MKTLLIGFYFLFSFSIVYPQQFWKNYFSGANIYDISLNDSIMWINTESRFVQYNFTNNKKIFHEHFNSLTEEQQITSVCLDDENNYWVSSYNTGLNKFDGISWSNYSPLNLKSFKCLTPNKKGQIWLTDYWGQNLILFKDTVIATFNFSEIEKMVCDSSNLWIISNNHLIKYDGNFFDTLKTPYSDSVCYQISNLFCDKNNNIWISGFYGIEFIPEEGGCFDYKNYLCKYSNDSWSHYPPPSGSVNSMQIDKDGVVWISNGEGLFFYENSVWHNFDIPQIPKDEGYNIHKINNLLIDKNNNFWIGVLNDGLYKMTNDSVKKIETSNSKLSDAKVWKIGLDKNGSKWILSHGFSLFKDTIWSTPDYPNAPSSTYDFTTDKNGNLYFIYGSLYKFDGIIFTKYSDDWVFTTAPFNLAYDNNSDNIWIGARFDALIKYDFINWDYYGSQYLNISTNCEKFVTIDTNSTIWMAAQWDIIAMNNGVVTYHLKRAISANTICVDKQNRIWVGGGSGLYLFDKNKLVEINLRDANLSTNVYSCTCDENNVWFGLFDGGLLRFDGTDWFAYNTENSLLPNSTVNTILIDDNIKYIGTNYGLSVFAGFDGNKISLTSSTISNTDEIIYSNQNISFYPNPANNFIYSKGVDQKPEKITIIDLYGRIIKISDFTYQNNELCINTGLLNSGFYIIQITKDNSEIFTGRIIIE